MAVRGEVGRLAKGDADGTAGKSELGDFWWDYKTSYTGGEPAFRERAANYYRKAIADGKLDGLKRTLVEQRLASLSQPDADMQVVDTRYEYLDSPDVMKMTIGEIGGTIEMTNEAMEALENKNKNE